MAVSLNSVAESLTGYLVPGDGATFVATSTSGDWPASTRLRVVSAAGVETAFTPVIASTLATWTLTVAEVTALIGTRTSGQLPARITHGTGDALRGILAGPLTLISEWTGVRGTQSLGAVMVGPAGPSAYAVAVAEGFVGDEAAWLASLVGAEGDPSSLTIGTVTTLAPGSSATATVTGTAPDQTLSLGIPEGGQGDPGPSAYAVAVAEGFVGDEAAWLASLVGPTGPAGSSTQVDIYYATGAAGSQSTYTWTKPAGAKSVRFFVVGGGGGGGSGRRGASGSVRCGGGGGGAGAVASDEIAAEVLGATVTVLVGKGGAGGASIGVDDTNGSNGTAGGISKFGAVTACGSSPGGGGTNATGTAGAGQWGYSQFAAVHGGAASTTGASGNKGGVPSNYWAASSGGGSGGGITTGDATSAGGAGGEINTLSINPGSTGGTADGGTGAAGSAGLYFGAGGGGGGSSSTTAGGAGGAGGNYGGGGGGGGASLNGYASGAGGAGGDGIVIVTTYF